MDTVQQRLARLRRWMAERGYAACCVPTDDFHLSEYVGDHFRARAWLSGFTGSAGTLAVLPEEAGLWTDSRYFLQAEAQLAGSGITLYRMGERDVPTVTDFLCGAMPAGSVLALDGRTVSAASALRMAEKLAQRQITLEGGCDPLEEIWEDRPPLADSRAWVLPLQYAGRSAQDKLRDVRQVMREKEADVHLLTSLDDIAWLLNIRGGDVPCSPVLLSYLAVEEGRAVLFADAAKLDGAVRAHLASLGVEVQPYGAVYDYAAACAPRRVLIDRERINYALHARLTAGGALLTEAENPTLRMKAVKNDTELANIRAAHVKDGVAVVRFMRWLKENVGRQPITECSAAAYLDGLRRATPGNLGLSFDTICGYGPHGAIVHYAAVPETDVPLEPHGLVLVDSGGQYYEGTTDVTRTIALGPLTQEEREDFALVLRSMLALADARFPAGLTCAALDVLSRAPLWERGRDFGHGTGHGVGYLLNVHEGPNRIAWRQTASAVMEPGMVTSDEPGLYVAGKYGIRTENLLICREAEETESGRFLCFETVTLSPIDLDAVDPALLTAEDRRRLNDYHRRVYEALSPELEDDERRWLAHCTRAV